MEKIKYSVVIPCFNEADNLELLLKSLTQLNIQNNLEIIIVDNGSKDKSYSLLFELKEKIKIHNLKVVSIKKNIGYGNGIIRGLNEASGDFLGWTHADLQTDVTDVLKGFKLIEKSTGNSIVKGKRSNRNMFDNIFTIFMSIVCTIILRKSLFDINAQPKIFSKVFYNQIKDSAPDDFSLDLYLLYMAKKMNYSILEFPVFFNKRLYGEAKGGGSIKTKLKLSVRTFSYILDIYRNER